MIKNRIDETKPNLININKIQNKTKKIKTSRRYKK